MYGFFFFLYFFNLSTHFSYISFYFLLLFLFCLIYSCTLCSYYNVILCDTKNTYLFYDTHILIYSVCLNYVDNHETKQKSVVVLIWFEIEINFDKATIIYNSKC